MLENKIALVTGGAQGIGKGIVDIYCKNGAKVVIADYNEEVGNSTEKEFRDLGYDVSFIKTDVTKESDIINMINYTINKYGRLDCVCNNAGITNAPKGILNISENDFLKVIDLDLKGVFLCLREEVKVMRNNGGTIVNIASTNGIVGTVNMVPYNSAKHGVIGLSKSVALEECKNNIRVNTVCPGATLTPLVEKVDKAIMNKFCESIPLGRMAKVEEIANAVLFLSSNMSTYMIGATLIVDGGVTVQ